MKHLTGDELSALLDGELKGAARQRAEGHLETCEACRSALGDLAAEHASLKSALTHDPGEAYFATFPAGVQDRIRTEARIRSRPAGGWFSRPRNVALAGAAAAVILGAGVVLIASQDVTRDLFRDRSAASSASGQVPPAPAESSQPTGAPTTVGDEERGGAASATKQEALSTREPDAAAPRGATPLRGATPARAQRVRRDAVSGEDVPVEPQSQFAAPPPAASPSLDAGAGPTTVGKLREQRTATPMQSTTQQSAPRQKSVTDKLRAATERAKTLAKASPPPSAPLGITDSKRDESLKDVSARAGNAAPSAALELERENVRVCGEVRDAAGRPLAGATVTLLSGAAMTRTDVNGDYCLTAPAGLDSMVVARLGFRPARTRVRLADGESLPATTLDAVALFGDLQSSGRGNAREAASAPTLAAFPDSLRADAVRAAGALTRAQRTGSAGSYDIAATMWERVVRRSEGTRSEIAARERVAESRFHAWEAGPTQRRADLALGALTSYIARAPLGADRDRAVRWVDRIKLGR